MARIAILLSILLLPGCGTVVPQLSYLKDNQLHTLDVHRSISCEIIDAVHFAYRQIDLANSVRGPGYNFFDDWGIAYTVTLNVIEDTSLNPTIDLLTPLTSPELLAPGAVVFTADAGIKLSAKATVTQVDQKFDPVSVYRDLKPCTDDVPKNKVNVFDNSLGISDWLAARIHLVGSGYINSLTPKESFTHEIKFEIASRGNIDPKWTFIKRNITEAGGLFNTGRTRTNTVLLTLGPVDSSRIQLSRDAWAVHNAFLIGDAIRNN